MTASEMPERYNVSTILDANLEAGRGAKAAIVGEYGEVSYERLLAMACAAGRACWALGVQREQRVLMVMDDTPAFPAVFCGAIRAGMVPVPLNPLFKADDYRYLLADSEARAVVADLDLLPKVREALAGHASPCPWSSPGARPRAPTPGRPAGRARRRAGPGPDPPRRRRLLAVQLRLHRPAQGGRPPPARPALHLPDLRRPGARHRRGRPVPVDHQAVPRLRPRQQPVVPRSGWGRPRCSSTAAPPPDRVLDAVERHRPSLLFSVPTLYNAMLATPEAKQRDLSSVRLCVSAAESLPAEIWRRWHDTYGLVILDGIGSTEMLHIFCSNTTDRLRPGSSGTAVPGYDLKLLGDTGEPVPKGETGTLYVRGDSALAGYWRQHDKTKQTVLGDWVWTGDRYRQDADGFWWHQGRVDDMLKVGGLWVSPVEMEQALAEHPAVYECAVVQVLVDGLTRIKAVVVCREADTGELTAELQAWCKQRLQRHEFPHIVEYTDELPKTTTGKIQRFKLPAAGRPDDRRHPPGRRPPPPGPPPHPQGRLATLGARVRPRHPLRRAVRPRPARSAPTASTPTWTPRASTSPC